MIWFQCLWLRYREKIKDLIVKFLVNTARRGDLICVGINERYTGAYGLEDILRPIPGNTVLN